MLNGGILYNAVEEYSLEAEEPQYETTRYVYARGYVDLVVNFQSIEINLNQSLRIRITINHVLST